MVVEKDGKDQLDRSCEKSRSITYSQEAEEYLTLSFRHRASCILGQAFHYSPENAFYIFNQQIYFII